MYQAHSAGSQGMINSDDELQTLLAAMLDGELSDAEQFRLAEILSNNPQAQQAYLGHCELHAFLQWEHGLLGGIETLNVSTPPLKQSVQASFKRRWWSVAAAVIVAFFGTIAVLSFKSSRNELLIEETSVAAVLSSSLEAHWDHESLLPGQVLHDGQRLELRDGVAELTFASGAKLVLEGPASMDVSSAWDATLRQGRVRADIPTEASGFRLISAEVEIERGTEYSLVADVTGESELFVHNGTVDASTRQNNGAQRTPIYLRAKEARRFSKSGVGDIEDRERKWVRFQRRQLLETPLQDATVTRWSFDVSGSEFLKSELNGKSLTDRTARSLDIDRAQGVLSTAPGRWNTALRMNADSILSFPAPELSLAQPRTVAFWVRIPEEDASEHVLAEWLAIGGKGGRKPLRVALNDGIERGARGSVRTDVGRVSIVSAITINDGKWHHIALVFVIGEGGAPLQYVDGRLNGSTVRTDIAKPPRIPRQQKSELVEGELFIGGRQSLELDELTLVDRALTPQEIRLLALENKLPLKPRK